MRRRPGTAGTLPDAPASCRPAFFGRFPEPLLHLVDRLALLHTVDEQRRDHAAPRQAIASELHVDAVREEDHGW
jgi:hypothetical protein